MTAWSTSVEDFRAELSARGTARPPATLGELWGAEWKSAGLDTFTGSGQPIEDAYEELRSKTLGAAGKDLLTLAAERGVNFGALRTMDERARFFGGVIATLPEDRQKELQPLVDVRARAADKAQAIEREATDVRSASYGLSAVATGFIAAAARQAVDPVNIASMPLGGPLKGPVLKMIAREFAFGAGAQLVQEPHIEEQRAKLGLESGFARGATDVLEAGVGQAGLASLFRGAAWGWRAMRGHTAMRPEADIRTGAPAQPVAAVVPLPTDRFDLHAEDFTAAAHLAERDHAMDAALTERAPVPEKAGAKPKEPVLPTPDEQLVHAQRIEETAAAIEKGDPPATTDLVSDLRDRLTAAEKRMTVWAPGNTEEMVLRGRERIALLTELQKDRPQPWMEAEKHVLQGYHKANPDWIARLDATTNEIATLRRQIADLERTGPEPLTGSGAALRTDETTLSPPAKAGELPQTRTRKRAAATGEPSLFQFLAARGGLAPHGDLKGILGTSHFVPGHGPLVRKTGMSLDRAREAALEAGYLHDANWREGTAPQSTTEQSLLDLIDAEARGQKRYPFDRGPDPARDKHAQERMREDEQRHVEQEVAAGIAAEGLDPKTFDDDILKRTMRFWRAEGGDVMIAYERAVMEAGRELETKGPVLHEHFGDLPGWDIPAEPRAASPGGRDTAQAGPGGQPGGELPGAGTGEASRQPGAGDRTAASAQAVERQGLAADAERVLQEAGGDLEILIVDATTGAERRVSARAALKEAGDDAAASRELMDCITNAGGSA